MCTLASHSMDGGDLVKWVTNDISDRVETVVSEGVLLL